MLLDDNDKKLMPKILFNGNRYYRLRLWNIVFFSEWNITRVWLEVKSSIDWDCFILYTSDIILQLEDKIVHFKYWIVLWLENVLLTVGR